MSKMFKIVVGVLVAIAIIIGYFVGVDIGSDIEKGDKIVKYGMR